MEVVNPTAQETRRLWLILGALALGSALSLLIWSQLAERDNLHWLWLQIVGAASFPGKYVIFSGLSPGSPLGPVGLGILCIVVDATVASVLALFLGPLGRLPRIGPGLRRIHDQAQSILSEYRRLARMAFVGVALFVFLPLPGTGAVGGVFAGQIVGLSRPQSILAVALGTSLQAALFAGLALTLGAKSEAIFKNPWISVFSGLGLIVFLYISYRVARKHLR